MEQTIEAARERGLIEDLPDGGIRALPALEQEMPVLYEAFRAAQREEFERDISRLVELGLVELIGASDDGFVFQPTEAGLSYLEAS